MNSLKSGLNIFENLDQNQELDESSDDTLHETIDSSDICYLCVHYSDGKCGATLYHSNSRSIQLVIDLEDNDFDSLEALLMQTEPKHVIISSKSDPKLIELLESCAKRKTQQMDDSLNTHLRPESSQNCEEMSENKTSSDSDLLWKMGFEFDVHIISFKDFDFESSKKKILSINCVKEFDFRDDNEKMVYLSSLIDFSNNNTLRSFGALIKFLDEKAFDIQMQTNCLTPEISSISRLYLHQLVTIERNTYESLQVFQQEWHPSAAKQGINQKEGLSLYGLFNCCVSKIGANCLRKMFLMPTQETDVIMDRLQAIEFFMEPNHHIIRDNLMQYLKYIRGVTALFNRYTTNTTLSIPDLQLIYINLWNAFKIREIIVRQNTDLQIFREIKENFNHEMERLRNAFNTVIDFEKSIQSQSFEVNHGIDTELDEIKQIFTDLQQILTVVAISEIETYGPILSECNSVYIPQLGFLTSSRVDPHNTPPHQLNEDLQLLVVVGDRYYYRTPKTLELDQRFGDIQSEIIDRQMQIINQFFEFLFNKRYIFQSIVKLCAKLDALIAMSRTALHYQFTKPKLTTDGTIEIIGGRHPLIELTSNSFIPNDYRSGGRYKRAKMISGPNACGKSVYLKQICLIVYLSHIGSYVPALSASVPIVDRIFTRLHTPESISLHLSTFMLDLNQMSNSTKNATKRSLVVIDEFGKGTQPIDGLALMAASVDHWLTTSEPHLVVSSHFRSLPSIVNNDSLIECQTFEFIQKSEGIQYLFKLTNGHFKESTASQIALMAGIDSRIVKRADQIYQILANNKTFGCLDSQQMRNKYKTYEEMAKSFIAFDLNSAEDIKQFFNSNFFDYSASEE